MREVTVHKIGTKVSLRDWSETDFDLFQKWNRLGEKWLELDGPYYEKSQQNFNSQFDAVQKQVIEQIYPIPRRRVVISDTETNQLLGTASCYWESIETNWLCAGITIYNPDYWGKGIGYEALGLWVEYLFENYEDIVRLDMRTWSGNIGLIKLAEKLGFIQEACFRKARIVKGEYFDSLGFGVLKEEFQNKYPNGFSAR